jgi:crossover junction endodeoxyribonuclease RuvC
MRVLGIDCGTEITGYGVIESDGRRHELLAAGVIRTRPEESLQQRLRMISEGLREVIARWSPALAAVETVFHHVNSKTVIKLAHARGVALLALADSNVPAGEYSPLEVKRSVVGYGRAEKEQVQLMVRSLLNLPQQIASKDAADALAVAICHATHHSTHVRIAKCS